MVPTCTPRDICDLDVIFSRQQADSLLATPFGLVIEGSVALKLAKKLCDPPLFSAGDELLKGSGDGGFLGRLSTDAEGSIEQLLVEGKIRGHVLLICEESTQKGPNRNASGVAGFL